MDSLSRDFGGIQSNKQNHIGLIPRQIFLSYVGENIPFMFDDKDAIQRAFEYVANNNWPERISPRAEIFGLIKAIEGHTHNKVLHENAMSRAQSYAQEAWQRYQDTQLDDYLKSRNTIGEVTGLVKALIPEIGPDYDDYGANEVEARFFELAAAIEHYKEKLFGENSHPETAPSLSVESQLIHTAETLTRCLEDDSTDLLLDLESNVSRLLKSAEELRKAVNEINNKSLSSRLGGGFSKMELNRILGEIKIALDPHCPKPAELTPKEIKRANHINEVARVKAEFPIY